MTTGKKRQTRFFLIGTMAQFKGSYLNSCQPALVYSHDNVVIKMCKLRISRSVGDRKIVIFVKYNIIQDLVSYPVVHQMNSQLFLLLRIFFVSMYIDFDCIGIMNIPHKSLMIQLMLQ